MPRKPTSVFLIIEQNASPPVSGLASYSVQRVPLGGQDPDEVIKGYLSQGQVGTTIYWVEDTKVSGKRVGIDLTDVDDPRLGHEHDDEDDE